MLSCTIVCVCVLLFKLDFLRINFLAFHYLADTSIWCCSNTVNQCYFRKRSVKPRSFYVFAVLETVLHREGVIREGWGSLEHLLYFSNSTRVRKLGIFEGMDPIH